MYYLTRLFLLQCIVSQAVTAPTNKNEDKAGELAKAEAVKDDTVLKDAKQNELLQHAMDKIEVVHKELLEKADSLADHPDHKKTNHTKKVNRDDIVSLLTDLEKDINVLKKKIVNKMKQLKIEEKEREMDITNINRIGNVDGEAKKIGLQVLDGDILITKGQEKIMRNDNLRPGVQLDAVRNPSQRWPRDPTTKRFRIPIRMAADISNNPVKSSRIRQAIQEFKTKTNIDIVPAQGNEHHIRILNDRGCYSLLGRITNVPDCTNCQPLSIGNGCESLGTVEHEFMHALGYIHEQARPDRDNTVRIIFNNIQEGLASQFAKQEAARINSAGLPYDINSIMQYGPFAFSVGGNRPTIVLASNGQTFATNRGGFSDLDIQGLNRIYTADSTGQPETGKDSTSCELFARLSLCSYTQVCSACKVQCTQANVANPIIGDVSTTNCNAWRARGLCNTNRYVARNCQSACLRAAYPDDGQCT